MSTHYAKKLQDGKSLRLNLIGREDGEYVLYERKLAGRWKLKNLSVGGMIIISSSYELGYISFCTYCIIRCQDLDLNFDLEFLGRVKEER